MSVKVVITDYIEPDLKWEEKELAKRGFPFTYHQLKFAPVEQVIEATRDADVVVVNMVKITREVIAAWEKCRLVIRHGVGYDNVDVDALTEKGIPLCYIPDYCAEEVAEQAIALIFACARRIPASRKVLEESSARGQWDFTDVIPIYRMAGRTLGILGCGRIGSYVYRKLQSFGFNFLICDPYLSEERRRELGVELVDKETLFRESDFITLHAPLNDETRRIVNAETLAMMKPTAYVINTARGPLVDHQALADALRNGTIAGAAIDVFDKEPPETDYPLFGLPNAILTPHLAWYSEDAAWRIREIILLEIDRFAAGQPPRYCVNPQVLS
ncbi:MAG TPA: C-terminal binding protein [Armatimonadota bacterium]|jgi:D-3-phosphoglycerate dehydrogenase|nr:C-terminal binding protein [Armatimonadota bacterium]HOJ20716.1 C-terminal binding protein [Armatimonadota bacterium]HOM80868.1 C-terminal binding protein [Armatimonadota bacterium]HOQ28137.1 C-terminal binding protein [Armatimonadota bacterium]HPO72259.1 C-terminal binding protein [Armatimonadota bacterium]